MPSTSSRASFATALLFACGARTELNVEAHADAHADADADAVHDASSEDVVPAIDVITSIRPKRITAGYNHTCAINAAGGVVCWGFNGDGEMGNGSNVAATNVATATSTLTSNVAAIAASDRGVCAVTSSGVVYCWGNGNVGQLGNGAKLNASTPQTVSGIGTNGAGVVVGGDYSNCVLLESGAVDCMGWNNHGQLGLGTVTGSTYDTPQPSKIADAVSLGGGTGLAGGNGYSVCAVLNGGSAQCWGQNPSSLGDGISTESGDPITVTGITSAIEVSTNYANACVVSSDGTLACWGDNTHGQLGDGTTTSTTTVVTASIVDVIAVSETTSSTCALTAGGAVRCVGSNYFGELGNGTTSNDPTTTWQTAINGGARELSCAGFHCCALMTTNEVRCWGSGLDGELGNGTYVSASTPVLVSGF